MRSDLISCKCERSEGIHFGLRAPLCTAHEILTPCHFLSTGVTSGQRGRGHRIGGEQLLKGGEGRDGEADTLPFDEVWIWRV